MLSCFVPHPAFCENEHGKNNRVHQKRGMTIKYLCLRKRLESILCIYTNINITSFVYIQIYMYQKYFQNKCSRMDSKYFVHLRHDTWSYSWPVILLKPFCDWFTHSYFDTNFINIKGIVEKVFRQKLGKLIIAHAVY